MTNNEVKLIELVRGAEDPTKAILTAIEVITLFLKQPRSSEEQRLDSQAEHV